MLTHHILDRARLGYQIGSWLSGLTFYKFSISTQAGIKMHTNQELKKIAQDFFDQIWNQSDESAIDRFIAEDSAGNDPQFGIGRESFREQWKNWRIGFPDVNFAVQELIADSETSTVVTRWILTGTHSGEFWGAAATGNRIKVDGVSIDRISNGMVVSGFDAWDSVVLRRQIGLLAAE
jgi:predicted ester cyclase